MRRRNAMQNSNVTTFDKEGVTVTLPDGVEDLQVRAGILGDLDDMPGQPGYFKPQRLVINLEFYHPSQEGQPSLTSWNARAKIQVRYTPEDVERARGWDNLKLGFYWERSWRLFTEKHKFERVPDEKESGFGWGVAYLESWEDPAIGWGS
jgi:hypothetical protein